MAVETRAEVDAGQVVGLKERLATDVHALYTISSGVTAILASYWQGYPDPSIVRSECSTTIYEALSMPGAEWPKIGISAALMTRALVDSDRKESALGEKNNG